MSMKHAPMAKRLPGGGQFHGRTLYALHRAIRRGQERRARQAATGRWAWP
jgi:hypothetical protein